MYIFNLAADGWQDLEVNYYGDSLESIARKLRDHSPAWNFLGNGGYTYDIPSMMLEGLSERGFVALPDYSDEVLYDLGVVDDGNLRYVQTTRYIPFDINSELDITIYDNWYKDFVPVNVFAFINGTSLADLGLSGQVLQNLRRYCNDSTNGWITWHEINVEWAVRYVEETDFNMLSISRRALRGHQQFSFMERNGLIYNVEYGLMIGE